MTMRSLRCYWNLKRETLRCGDKNWRSVKHRMKQKKKKLQVDIEKNSQKNSSLQHAAFEQQRADENVLKVAEEQKRQKEALHKRIIDLQQQLEVKQKLELEIEQLKGHLNVIKHVPDEDDKVDATMKDWRDLIVNEKRSNGELQDARKELIHILLQPVASDQASQGNGAAAEHGNTGNRSQSVSSTQREKSFPSQPFQFPLAGASILLPSFNAVMAS